MKMTHPDQSGSHLHATTAPTTLGVHSEAGVLRQAIVHRPGLELTRLTPDNVESMLFDDVLWVDRAGEEHDAFVGALRDHGVQVHYFAQLLAEALEVPQGRTEVLDLVCTEERLGSSLVGQVRELADEIEVLRATICAGSCPCAGVARVKNKNKIAVRPPRRRCGRVTLKKSFSGNIT